MASRPAVQSPHVLIVGGGFAGLCATRALSGKGIGVSILEARQRLGGRAWTGSLPDSTPVEFGAEFIHGAKVATWELIRASGLETREVTDRHWRPGPNQRLIEDSGFWDELEEVLKETEKIPRDLPFLELLERINPPPAARAMACAYVEGFHAAALDRISVKSLAQSEKASEEDEGQKQFRLVEGYSGLVEWLKSELEIAGTEILLGSRICAIHWRPGQVTIQSHDGLKLSGTHAIITLPVGVLSRELETLLTPALPEKTRAARTILAGNVAKAALQFSRTFWPEADLGFAHDDALEFPTFWTQKDMPFLTAWAGGRKADNLLRLGLEGVVEQAIQNAARMFSRAPGEVSKSLVAAQTHDWASDELSRGAYSYLPAGGAMAPEELAVPVQNTLFFAGEATCGDGRNGTVHGAIESGKRAAEELLAGLA